MLSDFVDLRAVAFSVARICRDLHSQHVVLMMDSSLVKHVKGELHATTVLLRNLDLHESNGRNVHTLCKQLALEDLTSSCELFAQAFDSAK